MKTMEIEGACGHLFTPKVKACPDGILDCQYCHLDEGAYVCPQCGVDTEAIKAEERKTNPLKGWTISEVVGVSYVNTNAVKFLEFSNVEVPADAKDQVSKEYIESINMELSEPEFVGVFPVRKDIEILPADEPRRKNIK